MPPDSPPGAVVAPAPLTSPPPGLLELFIAFAKMSLAGFGGVLVWARRGIGDQHKWMTADEFNETFALCHFLPGPNIVNLTFVFGSRFRGLAGAIAAFSGLVGPPALIIGSSANTTRETTLSRTTSMVVPMSRVPIRNHGLLASPPARPNLK